MVNFQMLHTVTHVHGDYIYFFIPHFSFCTFTDNIWMVHRLNPGPSEMSGTPPGLGPTQSPVE